MSELVFAEVATRHPSHKECSVMRMGEEKEGKKKWDAAIQLPACLAVEDV